jgi:TRAP-type mannitol/chloroaromatic compound transport system permease large subunit
MRSTIRVSSMVFLILIGASLFSLVFRGLGINPVWLGVLMAVNLQTSFLTPPFGFALFYLRGVAPATLSTGEIYRGAMPFVVLQLLALGLVALVPQLATWLPELVYGP